MKVWLLIADLEELAEAGLDPEHAFARGRAALAARPTHDKPTEQPGTEAGLRELVHLYAESAADMHLLQHAFVTHSRDYAQSRNRYALVEGAVGDLRRDIAPELRRRLRELRGREAALERKLEARGINGDAIGPKVSEGTAVHPSPRPGEGEPARRALAPLPPRRSLLERLLARVRRPTA